MIASCQDPSEYSTLLQAVLRDGPCAAKTCHWASNSKRATIRVRNDAASEQQFHEEWFCLCPWSKNTRVNSHLGYRSHARSVHTNLTFASIRACRHEHMPVSLNVLNLDFAPVSSLNSTSMRRQRHLQRRACGQCRVAEIPLHRILAFKLVLDDSEPTSS